MYALLNEIMMIDEVCLCYVKKAMRPTFQELVAWETERRLLVLDLRVKIELPDVE